MPEAENRYELLCEQLGAVTNEELSVELRALLLELDRRLQNYEDTCRDGGDDSRAAADEGLVLAARTERLLDWATQRSFHVRRQLEQFGWHHA